MAAVNPVGAGQDIIAALNGIRTQSGSSTSEVGDRFLRLLVTQLRNQDPLNPLDNAQVTTQMAQLSTVEGVNKLNDAIAGLADMYRASQSLQAASLIGRDILAVGDAIPLANSVGIAGVEIPRDADAVTVSVFDGGGNVVRVMNLGALDAGVYSFAWDGMNGAGQMLADGNYRFTVSAKAQGAPMDAVALALGRVDSVSLTAQGLRVDAGNLGKIEFNAIKQIM